MPSIYVKVDQDDKVIEACPEMIEGGEQITVTQAEFDQLMSQYDCTVTGGSVQSCVQGNNYTRLMEAKAEPA